MVDYQSPEAEGSMVDLTYEAEVDLSGSQYCVVVLGTSDGQVKLPAAVGAKSVGILQNAPAAGAAARVRRLGVSKIKANGAFSKGDVLTAAATTGKVDTSATTNFPVALAEEAATAVNDLVKAFVNPSLLPQA